MFALLLCVSVARPAGAQSAEHAAIDRAIAAVYPSPVRIAVVTISDSGGREIKHEAFRSRSLFTSWRRSELVRL